MSNALHETLAPVGDVGADSGPVVNLDDLLRSRFPSSALVDAVGGRKGVLSQFRSYAGRGGRREETAGVVWEFAVAGGMVALGTRDWGARERREAARVDTGHGVQADDDLVVPRIVFDELIRPHLPPETPEEWSAFERTCDVLEMNTPEHVEDDGSARRIVGWSPKSRSRMIRRLAELEYAPLFDLGRLPALQTLTLPADWLVIAPTGASFKDLVKAFRKRYERAYDENLVAVWKLEFQRRGAPHLHMFVAPPVDAPQGWHPRGCDRSVPKCGHTYKQWLSWTWAEVCAHPDPEQFRRHVLAGTNVDQREGLRATDPRRLAVYFAKHGSFSAKEYQHDVPIEWQDGCGRFWGYWRLKPVVGVTEVRPAVAIAAGRTLRRWSQADDLYTWKRVWRVRYSVGVSQLSGHVREFPPEWRPRRPDGKAAALGRWRRVKVPVTRMRDNRGFIVVNNGPRLVLQVVRHLETVEGIAPARVRLRPWWYSMPGLVVLPASM